MLLWLTVGLVVLGTVLLVLGFVENTFGYFYASIACAAIAGLTLVIFGRITRRRAARSTAIAGFEFDDTATEAPAERDAVVIVGPGSGTGEDIASAPEPDYVPVTGPSARPAQLDEPSVRPAETIEPPPVPVASRRAVAGPAPLPAPDQDEDWDDDRLVFPIEDYDDLRVAEILPLLPELDPDELEEVREREAAGKARGTILRRVTSLLDTEPGTVFAADASPRVPSGDLSAIGAAGGMASYGDPEEDDAGDEFPIADYDQLRAAEILPLLSELTPAELEMVAERERTSSRRSTLAG